jgi:hypothetical protein
MQATVICQVLHPSILYRQTCCFIRIVVLRALKLRQRAWKKEQPLTKLLSAARGEGARHDTRRSRRKLHLSQPFVQTLLTSRQLSTLITGAEILID